jgi:hypothetical protein
MVIFRGSDMSSDQVSDSPSSDSEGSLKLSGLNIGDLRRAVFDRLHDRQSLGPPIDPRGDVPSYVWLVEEYRKGSDRLQTRIETVADGFVLGLVDTRIWSEEPRINLLSFIQECEMWLPAIDDMIQQETLVSVPAAHVGLLKCLYGSPHQRRDPLFWLHQLDLLGPDYGAMVFRALCEHGLDLAAKYLPRCCQSDAAVNEICLLLPALVDEFGMEKIRKAIKKRRWLLPENAYEELFDTLRLLGGGVLVYDLSALTRREKYAAAAMWGALLDNPKRLLSDEATLRALSGMGVSEGEIPDWIEDRGRR